MRTIILIVTIAILSSCTPKQDYKEKMIEFAIKDLHKQVKVPSSFLVDSTNIIFVEDATFDKYNGKYQIFIYYQAQNAFGALLKDEALYYIERNPSNGKLSVYDKFLK